MSDEKEVFLTKPPQDTMYAFLAHAFSILEDERYPENAPPPWAEPLEDHPFAVDQVVARQWGRLHRDAGWCQLRARGIAADELAEIGIVAGRHGDPKVNRTLERVAQVHLSDMGQILGALPPRSRTEKKWALP